MDNRRRRDLDTSSGFGVGVQRFPSALPSSSSFLDNLETRCTELFCLAKINQVPTLGYSEDLGLIDRSLFLERHTSSTDILSAIPLRLDGGQEVSSISEVNIEPQSVQKTSDNYINSHMGLESPSAGRTFQNWADNHSSKGETSTSMEGEAKEDDHRFENGNHGDTVAASWSLDHGKAMPVDSKVLRRLAQNREAARKSRLRKKAYVQQLESSRVKMNQLEQELEHVRQQGMFLNGTGAGEHNHPGVVAFDTDYAKWVEEQNRQLCDLRSALAVHIGDSDLRLMVDNATSHYDELFRLKGVAVKADVFHIMSGMWRTPAERCFMWMGGLRPSELLKVVIPQLETLTEQQLLAVCNLEQSTQQAEEALSQGMETLQHHLADTLTTGALGTPNVANYMSQMAMAMGKLGTLESFVRQADNLRQQSFHQMNRILTTRQAARALLALGEYVSRLRALSSLWTARPRE